MENAVDAMKMAFAVIIFTISLSIAIYMFGEARTTADAVLYSSDVTQFMEYQEATEENRIVGLETIIPTLYKYYKENYAVIFKENSTPNGFLRLYETKKEPNLWSTGYHNQYYGGNSLKICSFDVDDEDRRHEPWVLNEETYKSNLDAFLSGGRFVFPNGSGDFYDYSTYFPKGSFIEQYKDTKFIENLGEYVYNEATVGSLIKEKKKRVIIYTVAH